MQRFLEIYVISNWENGKEEIKTVNCFQMSSAPWTATRPGEERDASRILEMLHEDGWVVPTETMLMDLLRQGVVRVTTDADDHVLSK